MKKILLILLPLLLTIPACDLDRIDDNATGNATKFNTSFGGNGHDYPNDINANTDGTYIVAGSTTSFTSASNSDAYLSKVGANGILIWENHYGTPDYDDAQAVIPVSDGGFIICGSAAEPSNSYANIFLVKVNSAGTEVWRKIYGATDSLEVAFGIVPTGSGDFLVGYTTVYIFGTDNPKSIRFLRINANGSKVSDKLGATIDIYPTDMIKASDNSIVVSAVTDLGQAYTAKFMETGSLIWDQVFPEIGTIYAPSYGVIEMDDKSLILGGSFLGSSDHDFMIISYTEIGMKLEEVIWGGANADELLGITKSQDDEIVVMGYSGSFSVNNEIYISKRRKSDGGELWAKHFGNLTISNGGVEACPDGGFVIFAAQFQSDADIILIKTDPNGNYE